MFKPPKVEAYVNAAIKRIKTDINAIKRWDIEYFPKKFASPAIDFFTRMKNKSLENKILNKTEIIPCHYLEWDLFEICHFPKKDNYESFIQFLNDQTDLLKELRTLSENVKIRLHNIDLKQVDELLKSKVLGLNRDSTKTVMKNEVVRKNLFTFFLQYPQTMTWQEIYAMHYRDVKKVKVKWNVDTNNFLTKSPWKTRFKVQHYGNRYGWNEEMVDKNVNRDGADTFDMRKQRKLMTHYVAPRYTLVVDYFHAGKFKYLLAINVNTRKAFYTTPKEIQNALTHNYVPDNFQPNDDSIIDSLKKIMLQTPIRNLMGDNQFNHAKLHRFYKDNNIEASFVIKNDIFQEEDNFETNDKRRSNHSTTSLVDRLIRTIRLMNYNLGYPNEITPIVMERLINEYNNSPHGTLSKILKKPTTPNEVDANVELENKIVKRLMAENFCVRNQNDYKFLPEYVRVINEAHKFDKVKNKLLPGHWKVVGMKNGMFELKQNDKTIFVSRWQIQTD